MRSNQNFTLPSRYAQIYAYYFYPYFLHSRQWYFAFLENVFVIVLDISAYSFMPTHGFRTMYA